MARMNDFARAELLKGRLAEYEAAGLDWHRSAKFGRDMVARAEGGKGFTAGQRRWVMSIIDEDLPVAKDPERFGAIIAASDVEGLKSRSRDILRDFSRKVFNGWALSVKQERFLEGLLTEAEDCRTNGPWLPTAPQLDNIHSCARLGARYNDFYLMSHPGLSNALNKARRLVMYMGEGRGVAASLAESVFDEWCMNKLFKQFKTPLGELASPKHPVGETRFFVEAGAYCNTPRTQVRKDPIVHIALIVDEPLVDKAGAVAYPVIVNGEMKNIDGRRLGKRRPRRS